MLNFKKNFSDYSKYYILSIVLLWIGMFFVPWDKTLFGVSIYLFVMQKLFIVFGLTAIFMAFVSKKINLFIWGILFIFAFWINMFLLFSVLPILGN